MLRLIFRPIEGESIRSARAAFFRFCGDGTLRGPDNSVAAAFVDFCWLAGGHRFRGFECAGPVALRVRKTMADNPVQMGPYGMVRTGEGNIYADELCLAGCVPGWNASIETYWHEVTLLPVSLNK